MLKSPNFGHIPDALKRTPRWVCWRMERGRKVPYDAKTINSRASSTDPATWASFTEAQTAYEERHADHDAFSGVGIVLNGDGLAGVDIDHCVSDGKPNPAALELLDSMGAAYIEVSPSGTGLRAFGYAPPLDSGCKGKLAGLDLELYSEGRYLTLTGHTLKAGEPAPLLGFDKLAQLIRGDRKKDPVTGESVKGAPDERHAELVRRILLGDVFHDSLRDLAASLVATGMHPGACVNHLRGLMDSSAAPKDDRWKARRAQIPDLVNSAAAKFEPLDCAAQVKHAGAANESLLKPVSVIDALTNPAPLPDFIWDGYLPCGVVSLLGAHGGTGKSTVALMLAVAAALGRPVFGVDTVPCKTLFASLEDGGQVVRWRLAQICRHWNIEPSALEGRLHIVDGTENPELFSCEGRGPGMVTMAYVELEAMVQREGIGFVVVDNASDAFGGDEIQRRQVRAFMRTLASVARLTHCAVLLLAHVDKGTSRARKSEGGEGYSGSTAWHNSARSRLFISRAESGLLTLEHQKANFGKLREPVDLEWPADGLPQLVSAVHDNPCVQALLERAAGRVEDERAADVLRMLAEFEGRGHYASPVATARNNVHAMLRVEPAFQKLKLGKDATARIVNQCQRAKWIEVVEYRTPDRKTRQRWALTTAGRDFAGLAAPSAPSAPSSDGGAERAQSAEGAPSAPSCVGGMGE
jgi:RecA-family ATPase